MRRKLLISAVLIFLGFAVVSALISYVVSVSLVRRDIMQYHQYELQVLIDQYREQRNRIRERVAILTADEKLSSLVRSCIEAESPYQIQQNLNDLEHYLYLLLYLNPELESLYLNTHAYRFSYDKGASLVMTAAGTGEGITDRSEKIISLLIKEDLQLQAVQEELFSFDPNTYSLAFIDPRGEIVEWKNSDTSPNLPYNLAEVQPGVQSTIRGSSVFTVNKRDDGYTFVLCSPTEGIDTRLVRAGLAIALCLLATSLFYGVFCFFYSKHLIHPLNEMGKLFGNMQSYADEESIRRYYQKYKGEAGLHPKVFRYYRTAMAPLLIIIVFSFAIFLNIVNYNQKQSETRLMNTFAASLQHNIESFELFTKFLSLSDTIQDVMINESLGEYGPEEELFNEISGYLVREGIFSSGILAVNLYDREGALLYNSDFLPPGGPKENQFIRNDFTAFRTHTVIFDNSEGSESLRFVSRINSLPEIARVNPMTHLGYLEVAVEDFMPEKLALIKGDETIFFKLIHEKGDADIIPLGYSGMIYPIGNTNLQFALGLAFSGRYAEKIQIILLDLILLLLQIILVLIISRYFENRILRPLSRLEEYIRGQGEEQDAGFDSRSSENEFIRLADSFNRMMARLNRLSTEMRELELKAHQSDLVALQAQIKPHFFNNIIASILLLLNNSKNDEAMKMLNATARHFRGKIFGRERFIPVSEEIQHLENYVQIQNYRFENRINLRVEDSLDLEKYLLPRLLLQPLVENSITHGMKESALLAIAVRVSAEAGTIRIEVEDDGLGMDEEKRRQLLAKLTEPEDSEHYGLANIAARLDLLGQQSCRLEIESEKGRYTRVILEFPLMEADHV